MREPETNPKLTKAVLDVVENQIRDDDPPETRQTVARLVSRGYSPEHARRLVAMAVSVEIYGIMARSETFDRKRFVWNLNRLPEEPWDSEGALLYPA